MTSWMANFLITLLKYSNNPLSSAQYSTLLTAALYLVGLNGIKPKWQLFIWITLVTCFSASTCLTLVLHWIAGLETQILIYVGGLVVYHGA